MQENAVIKTDVAAPKAQENENPEAARDAEVSTHILQSPANELPGCELGCVEDIL